MDLSKLNAKQREAAEKLEGPLLIIAGAGSGKTRTMTYRIANLLYSGVPAYKILALTFTNKAAKEMRERIIDLVDDVARDAWIGTFHSICVRILRKDIEKLGYTRNFTIYDDEDQLKTIKDILKYFNLDDKVYSPKEIRGIISDAKNKMMGPDEWFNSSCKDFRSQKIHEIFLEYEKRLKNANALDFDDLIVKTLQLFVEHPDILSYYQNRFSYVHVDEYQDTNRAQYLLVKMISEKSRNICVVGDDDQSIYGWRGADIRNILDFETDYKEATIIKLEQNYRSTRYILDAANEIIKNNAERREKKLWTEEKEGAPIRLYCARDERAEAAWLCERIEELRFDKKLRYNQICVLYRTHAQSRVIEEMLMRAGIPYKVFGGTRFYDRKEIKDALAYLRLLVNPHDDIALKRIINVPKRSIGDTTVSMLDDIAKQKEVSIYEIIRQMPESVASRPRKCIENFCEVLDNLLKLKEELPLSEFIETFLDASGLKSQYEGTNDEEAVSKKENLLELLGAVKEFERLSEDKTLEAYLENVSLVTDLDMHDNDSSYVTLLTIHSAKGLEYDAVFLLGMEDGLFPSTRTILEDRLEEERRLCYVGVTRAKKYLFISYARQRLIYNQISYNQMSRFIKEIPSNLISDNLSRKMSELFGNSSSQMERFQSKNKSAEEGVKIGSVHISGVSKGFIPSPVRAKTEKPSVFEIGDRVIHKHFGEGTVKNILTDTEDTRIVISFTAYGDKQFALSIAPIVKLG